MVARRDVQQKMLIDGAPYTVVLIDNPTIDDVVVTEARAQAASIEGLPAVLDGRKVSRDIRDFLIRLGVER